MQGMHVNADLIYPGLQTRWARPRPPLFLSIRINCLSGSKFFHGLIVAVITSDHIA